MLGESGGGDGGGGLTISLMFAYRFLCLVPRVTLLTPRLPAGGDTTAARLGFCPYSCFPTFFPAEVVPHC